MSTSRGLIKSMLIIGSARAVNILISIVRMKLLALLVGPTGIGLLSIYNNIQAMGSQVAGLGMGSSGVREIASASGEKMVLSRVRKVLFAAHLAQGLLAMFAVWLFRDKISVWLFGNQENSTEVGLIGIAILFSLLSAAQTALLQGSRRIADLGRVTIVGALVATFAGLLAVYMLGEAGLIWFLLVQPLAALFVARYFTSQLPKPNFNKLSIVEIWDIWKPMARLGFGFMLGGLATSCTLLIVRSRITDELGLDAAGHFAAAWGVSMTYVGFMLSAMGADYYPRLSEIIENKVEAIRLVNDQAQLTLAIGGPIMIFIIGFAQSLIGLLYSSEFDEASNLLQWQTVGNIFKLIGWPLGFIIIAQGRSKTFMFLQLNWNIIFLFVLWPTLDILGIVAAGPAFAVACVVQLVVVTCIVRFSFGFHFQRLSVLLLGMHVSLAATLFALALSFPIFSTIISPFLALATGIFGVRVVLLKIGPEGKIASRLARLFSLIGWPIRSNT